MTNDAPLDEATAKRLAVANLNQLTYYVNPRNGTGTSTLPGELESKRAIFGSLQLLGLITIGTKKYADPRPSDFYVKMSWNNLAGVDEYASQPYEAGFEQLAHEVVSIEFTAAGLQKLIAQGVSTPTLDALNSEAVGRHAARAGVSR